MYNLFNLDEKKGAGLSFSLFCLFYIVATFIFESIMLLFCSEGSFIYNFAVAFVSPCVMLFIYFFYCKKKETSLTKTLPLKKFKVIYIPIILLTVFGMYFGFGLINEKVSGFIIKIGLKIHETNFSMANIWQFLGYVLVFAILPAFAEELFFRGLILGSLKKVSPVIAVVFSALLFALYHGNISQFFYQIIYGVLFALIFISSSSVVPCMAVHFLNNFIILLFMYLKVDLSGLMVNPLIIVIGIICVVTVLTLSVLKIKKENKGVFFEKSGGAWAYSSIGIILTSLLIILNMVI